MVTQKLEVNQNKERGVTSMVTYAQQGEINVSQVELKQPSGLYGRYFEVSVGAWFSASLAEFDIEATIPFDDDTEANEAEITIYNLSDEAVSSLEYNAPVTITAGYNQDSTGVIFQGVISEVKTKKTSVDKITTIYATDSKDLTERDMVSTSYSAGTQASAILRDLVNQLGLPIAEFTTVRDYTYENDQTTEGGLMSKIRDFAGLCGVCAYINKQAVYVQPLDYAESDWFDVSNATGLIGDVEISTEEKKYEDYTDTRTVYTLTMLLNHRIQPSSAINLTSKEASGRFRVFKGEHICNENEFYTKVSCY